jgi:hypothetical protein
VDCGKAAMGKGEGRLVRATVKLEAGKEILVIS